MKHLMLVIGLAIAVAAVLVPFDQWVYNTAGRWVLAGDVRRTVETLQQYGDVSTIGIVSVVIWLLAPLHRRSLINLFLSSACTALACLVLKILVGRPRPQLDAPLTFLGPWGNFALTDHHGKALVMHASKIMDSHAAQLWSMPSSHTAAAVALSLFLIHLFPRITPFAIAMVIIVGLGRVLTGAHYPSDLVIGAAIGYAVTRPILAGSIGTRLFNVLKYQTDRSAAVASTRDLRKHPDSISRKQQEAAKAN